MKPDYLLLNQVQTFFALLDLTGTVEYANKPPLEMGGFTLNDVIGNKFYDISWWTWNPEVYEHCKSSVQEAANGKSDSFTVDIKAFSGTVPIIFNIEPRRNEKGKIEGIICECQITLEQRKTETQLKKMYEDMEKLYQKQRSSGRLYKALVETTNTGYVVVDTDGKVIDANSEYIHLTGHKNLEEILGRSVAEWTAPYDAEKNTAAVKTCGEQGFIRDFQTDYIHPDKTVVPIEINATVFTNEHGEVQILTLCRDISKRREMELLAATAEADKKVSAELRALNQQLAAKEQALHASQEKLEQQISNLERINKLMIGREIDMIKLKERVNTLLQELGREPEHKIPSVESQK